MTITTILAKYGEIAVIVFVAVSASNASAESLF